LKARSPGTRRLWARAARDGFEANEYVEISGHATQSGGAFANIYEIAQVPTANGPESDPSIDVTVESRSTNQFRKDQDITVVVRVAKVWVTVLGNPLSSQEQAQQQE